MPAFTPARYPSRSVLFASLVALGIGACSEAPAPGNPGTGLSASITHTGRIECFPADAAPAGDKPATCELSAVAFDGSQLVFGNDKPIPIPNYSPVFAVDYPGGPAVADDAGRRYFLAPAFTNAVKYEGMTRTPDGQWILATTAFDRFDQEKSDLDRYNTLLAWPVGKPDRVAVVAASERQGITSSAGLREKFLKALNAEGSGWGYFKIEGLAALPGNRLLFGVREFGQDYKHFQYTIKFIEAGYEVVDGHISLSGDFKLVYDFKPDDGITHHRLSLSSLEFDPAHDRLYLLTTFEEGDKPDAIGAYLWVLSLRDLARKQVPTIVTASDDQPLALTHKAEGLAVLDAGRILLINDDDRIITPSDASAADAPRERRLNEAVYQVLKWN